MRLLPSEVGLPGTPRRSLSLLVALAGVGLFPRLLRAEELVRLDYLAPVGCPESTEFMERVKQRVPTARAAAPEELARQLVIAVNEDEDGFAARLDFIDVRGETITRTLSGKTCDEVVTGIALVTALALEAQHDNETAVAEPAPTPSDAAAPAEAPPEPVPEPKRVEPRPSPPVAHPPLRRRRPTPPHLVFGAGLGGGNAWYVAPGTPIVFDGAFRIGHTAYTGSARAGARLWLASESVAGRSASFIGFAGVAELCPVASPRLGVVRFEPCGALTVGVLEGAGEPTASLVTTESSQILWADFRAIARLRLAVTALVELEGQAELGVPLRTHRFSFANPDQTVFQIPAAGFGWRAGVMLHFP